MPRYTIALISPENKPGGSVVREREERQFANLGEALQRGREMYRVHEKLCDWVSDLRRDRRSHPRVEALTT